MEKEFPWKSESYELIGLCMEVHRTLGHGFLEIVYKDAIELELLRKELEFSREQQYPVEYKGVLLSHRFYADFVLSRVQSFLR